MKKLTANQYAKVLFEVTQGLKSDTLNQTVSAFVDMARKNQAWRKMLEITKAFQTYARKQEGWVELHITSAHELSHKTTEDIKKHFGGQADVIVVKDKMLVGGIKIKTDNKIFDASVKQQLIKMKEVL